MWSEVNKHVTVTEKKVEKPVRLPVRAKKDNEDNDSVIEKKGEIPSKIPQTLATITQLLREGQDKTDKVDNIESILKSLEQKMNKMVSVEYLEKQFKKMITQVFSSKTDLLKQQLKRYFSKGLEKAHSKIQNWSSWLFWPTKEWRN